MGIEAWIDDLGLGTRRIEAIYIGKDIPSQEPMQLVLCASFGLYLVKNVLLEWNVEDV